MRVWPHHSRQGQRPTVGLHVPPAMSQALVTLSLALFQSTVIVLL